MRPPNYEIHQLIKNQKPKTTPPHSYTELNKMKNPENKKNWCRLCWGCGLAHNHSPEVCPMVEDMKARQNEDTNQDNCSGEARNKTFNLHVMVQKIQ